jgi:hypothetical protein
MVYAVDAYRIPIINISNTYREHRIYIVLARVIMYLQAFQVLGGHAKLFYMVYIAY